jgi:type II secretory pathway pseudopilin PulG
MLEMMVAIAILMIVSGVVMSGLLQTSLAEGTIQNRTEMHSSVRGATELMQQEIGQAGRVAFPTNTTFTLAAAVPAASAGTSSTVGLSSSSGSFEGIFIGQQIVVGSGTNQETVTITAYAPATNSITAIFNNLSGQVSGAPVYVQGTFPSGIVPTTAANGSTGSVLKLYGDVNSDGNMVYIEYTCDTSTSVQKLYRNVMAYDAISKPSLSDSLVLLPNILPNPDGSNCFSYQQKVVGADTYVVDVAVTLTIQTQNKDPRTKQYQTETKALLNVSPRNVFEGWQLASAGVTNRIQAMPANVTCLLSAGSTTTCPGPGF